MTCSTYSNPIIKKAQELLKAYGMNPCAVTIINSTYYSPACVTTTLSYNNPTHTLYLDIPYLQTLSPQEYTAIIKHELMHLWYADPMRLTLLFPLIPCLNPDNEPLIGDYRKNFEMRADIMGTFHDTADIHGLASYFSKYISYDTGYNPSHPTFAQRLAALKGLLVYKSEAVKYAV
jgi:Zn-dependent protease with chaperone function